MNLPALIRREHAGVIIEQRAIDGYFNATAMCQAVGKQFHDYRRLKTTKAFLKALEAKTGIPVSEQIQSLTGGNSNQGTWIEPRVAANLAQWLSPEFAVQVAEWIVEWSSGRKSSCMEDMLERVLNRCLDQGQVAIATSQVALATANEAKQDCADLRRLVITGRSGNIVAIGLRCEDVTETKKLRVKAYSATRTHASKCGIPTKLFARQHEWNTHNMMHDIKHASLNGCRYCRKSFEDISKELGKPLLQVMSIDIRYPKQSPNYRANTDWICGLCNSQKRDMTPEEFIAYLNAKKAEQAKRQEQEAQQLKLFP